MKQRSWRWRASERARVIIWDLADDLVSLLPHRVRKRVHRSAMRVAELLDPPPCACASCCWQPPPITVQPRQPSAHPAS